jgi:hypothetical protein
MTYRLARFCVAGVAAALVLLLSTTAVAQGPEGPFSAEQEGRIRELVGQEVTKITEAMSDLRTQIIAEIQAAAATPQPAPAGQQVQPLTLEERVEFLERLTQNQQQQIEGLVDGTSPSIRNMQTRLDEAEQALNRSTGTLYVRNNMASGYYLRINGKSKFFAPGEAPPMQVPAGTLITELEGYERPRNWTIGPPNFAQTIEINPRHTTYRPASPPPASPSVVVNPSVPVLVDPLYFVGPTWVWDPFWGTYVLR